MGLAMNAGVSYGESSECGQLVRFSGVSFVPIHYPENCLMVVYSG